MNGIGFFIGSIFVLVLGLQALGGGDAGDGVYKLVTTNQQMLNAVSSPKVNVPFAAIFTGMLLINIYWACTNQVIIQRALGAKSVAEGQKGVLFAGLIKVISILILIVPGIIAFHLYGNEGIRGDEAYPLLVSRLLPNAFIGFFGAVLFGAIISTFNSTINSCSTIFAVNIYKPYKKGVVNNSDSIKAGKWFGTGLAIFAAICAPFIKSAPQGLYMFMQEFNALFTVPMLLMILVGMLSKTASSKAVLAGMATYGILYLFFKFAYTGWDLHFLHKTAIYFVVGLLVTAIISYRNPIKLVSKQTKNAPVNVENWKYLPLASIATVGVMVATYAIFSPIGVVAPVEEITSNIIRIIIGTVAGVFVVNHLYNLVVNKKAKETELKQSPISQE